MTTDGVEVTLLANIGTPAEAAPARALGARGVGLFRTEFLFLERSTPPSEDEQARAYREAVEAFGGDPVTIRLLDIGGDKPIPYLPMPTEDNPFLGVRALRLAVRPAGDLPDPAARLLPRCGAGPVKVMAPMVADARRRGAAARPRPPGPRGPGRGRASPGATSALGVMLEIPSAVLAADTYFGQIAFASLGTNDLTQYTLAVDRGNPALERYRDAMHPAVLRLIAGAAESARWAGISLSVCGEMGGDPVAALALVGLGVTQLSMGAASLPAVRRAIRCRRLRGAARGGPGRPLGSVGSGRARAQFTAHRIVPDADSRVDCPHARRTCHAGPDFRRRVPRVALEVAASPRGARAPESARTGRCTGALMRRHRAAAVESPAGMTPGRWRLIA